MFSKFFLKLIKKALERYSQRYSWKSYSWNYRTASHKVSIIRYKVSVSPWKKTPCRLIHQKNSFKRFCKLQYRPDMRFNGRLSCACKHLIFREDILCGHLSLFLFRLRLLFIVMITSPLTSHTTTYKPHTKDEWMNDEIITTNFFRLFFWSTIIKDVASCWA